MYNHLTLLNRNRLFKIIIKWIRGYKQLRQKNIEITFFERILFNQTWKQHLTAADLALKCITKKETNRNPFTVKS